jgi:hypothetical protein
MVLLLLVPRRLLELPVAVSNQTLALVAQVLIQEIAGLLFVEECFYQIEVEALEW